MTGLEAESFLAICEDELFDIFEPGSEERRAIDILCAAIEKVIYSPTAVAALEAAS
jgi:hypothetical protein